MTSPIFPPRSALAPCSPSTHEMASTTLDLPEPLGPTTQVIPGSSFKLVADAKDLKPFTVRVLRCTNLRLQATVRYAARVPWRERVRWQRHTPRKSYSPTYSEIMKGALNTT